MKSIAKLFFASLVAASPFAHGADWPQRPITIAQGFSPGGASFVIAQELATRLSQRLGQTVVVEEKSGASGTIATAQVLRSAPEGYVFGVMSNSTLIAQIMQAKGQVDPMSELTPVSKLAEAPLVLAVSKSLPATNLREFIALLKANPGKYSYGTTGVGSSPHFATEMLKKAAGVDVVHIPYRGSPPMHLALRRGEIAMFFDIPGNVIPLVEQGLVRMIATASKGRSPSTGDTPPIASEVPGLEIAYWMGLYARAGTPDSIVKRMSDEVAAILKEPEMAATVAKWRLDTPGPGPEELRRTWQQDSLILTPLVNTLGLRSGS